MNRFFLTSGLILGSVVSSAQAQQQAEVQVQVQVKVAQPVPAIETPVQEPGKPREEVKVDPKTDPNPKSLEIPAEQIKQAEALVRQLSSPSYRDRDSATRELQKMGRVALGPLQAARANDSNPEVRLRTEMCLPVAEADDMKARVNCFLADVEAKYEHTLPGWNKFKDVVGTDKSARELFAEVLKKRDMHNLLMAAEQPAHELAQTLGNFYREALNQGNEFGVRFGRRGGMQQQMGTAEIIVLAFLESVYDDREVTLNYNFGYSVSNHLYNQDIQNAMSGRGGKYAEPIKKVVNRWLETRVSSMGAQMAMNFATNWNLQTQIGKYAARVLEAPVENGNYWIKINAITVLGQRNNKEHLAAISKCFEDSNVIQQAFPGAPANQQNTITLGDFALGVAISLAGQAHKDYGMEVMPNGYKWNQNNYYFKDEEKNKADDKRKAAIKKFEEWLKKEKEAKKDEPKKDEPKKDEPKKEEPKSGEPVPVELPRKAIPKK